MANNTHRIQSGILMLAGLAFLAAGCVSQPVNAALLTVSFPDVKLEPDEYIQSVAVRVTFGRVVSVNHILGDWDTEVEWDNPGLKVVNLQAVHFVSGLTNTHELDGFITVSPDNSFFAIQAELHTESTDSAGRAPRKITFSQFQLVLQAQPSK